MSVLVVCASGTFFCCSAVLRELEALPLDPSRLIALVIIHMLQADSRATPCSQPLQQRASATAAA